MTTGICFLQVYITLVTAVHHSDTINENLSLNDIIGKIDDKLCINNTDSREVAYVSLMNWLPELQHLSIEFQSPGLVLW